jgi:hypothetical protein
MPIIPFWYTLCGSISNAVLVMADVCQAGTDRQPLILLLPVVLLLQYIYC